MLITCNNCMDEFEIEPADVQTVTMEGLEIQFFPCPSCGRKYVVFAADKGMKDMISKRVELQKALRRAHVGKFRQKIIRGMMAEQEKIIREQKKLMVVLKYRAEKLLEGAKRNDETI